MLALRRFRLIPAQLAVAAALALPAAPRAGAVCVGDCTDSGAVSIAFLVIGVNIALGRQSLDRCAAFDANDSGGVEVNELIRGVNNALNGCPVEPTATPGATPTVGGGVLASGDEVAVNTFTTGGQSNPVAAPLDGPAFVTAWQSGAEDGDDYGIVARRLDSSGQPAGAPTPVNQTTASAQRAPAVASSGDRFVVAWSSYGQDGDGDGVFAQRFAAGGGAIGTEFAVNQFTTRDQTYGGVAVRSGGDFVVVWESNGQDGSGRGIFARSFDGQGAAQGDETQVNAAGTGDQRRPAIAALHDGAFAVVWMSDRADGDGRGIVARRLTAGGAPTGGEFAVNSTSAGDQAYPAVAAVDGGTFVVAWESDGQDGDGRGVFARFFRNDGTPLGQEFGLNSDTAGNQRRPALSPDGAGGFVATWESAAGAGSAVFGQRFDSRARARGARFQVPAQTAIASRRPAVASAGDGFVVVWETYPDGDGDGYGIAARRFQLLP